MERVNFPSEKNDCKKFETNNVTIALNVLYVKKQKIYPAYISNNNLNREKQVFYFNDSKQIKMALSCKKKLSAFLRE